MSGPGRVLVVLALVVLIYAALVLLFARELASNAHRPGVPPLPVLSSSPQPASVVPTAASRTRPLTSSAQPPIPHRHPRRAGARVLSVTAYTWTGNRTASGQWPRSGMAASNTYPLGTWLYVEGVGRVVVQDRIGCCTDLDIYMDSKRKAVEFGRRELRVWRLS